MTKDYIEIDVPKDFSFQQCMVYLNRSDIECLHKIKDGEFYKLLKFQDVKLVIKISMEILKQLQFTTRKAEYIIGISKLFNNGIINKEELALEKDYEKLKKR